MNANNIVLSRKSNVEGGQIEVSQTNYNNSMWKTVKDCLGVNMYFRTKKSGHNVTRMTTCTFQPHF